ncbi:hypothetical protein [Streptomyces sp. NPDC056527]|uniref:hypothetical protein n=1 Tax=Streptomyces sp. NPDC056527 TaxID=3345853 RepID=UPI003689A2A2
MRRRLHLHVLLGRVRLLLLRVPVPRLGRVPLRRLLCVRTRRTRLTVRARALLRRIGHVGAPVSA